MTVNARTVNVVTVDCLGLQCPAPILAISKAARTAPRPTTLEVHADDGDFAVDLRAWCRSTGAVLESLDETDGTFVARISLEPDRAAEAPAPPEVSAVEIDCRGMICPAPILQLSRSLRAVSGPSRFVVFATDQDFPRDVEAWCRSTGNRLVGLDRQPDGFVATIDVVGAAQTPAPAPTVTPMPPAQPPAPAPAADGVLDLRGRSSELGILELGQRVMAHETVRFVADHGPIERQLRAWAAAIGATLDLSRQGGLVRGTVRLTDEPGDSRDLPAPAPSEPVGVPRKNQATLLVLRNDFESLMAAMMVANASAAQGMKVEVYFAFWGINVLRTQRPRAIVRSSPLRRLMKWMMPAGPEAQPMSKMNFGGIGLGMMKGFMREQRVLGLSALMREAAENDVKFVACTMSMGIMGVDKADLMDLPNLEFGGVTSFSGAARESALSLVF